MGLLDYQPDPIGQGLLGFGTALMQPRALGGGMAAGLQAFNTGALQANALKRQQQQDALREQLLQAQMAEYGAQTDERKMKAAQLKAAMDRDERIRRRLAGEGGGLLDAPGNMPTPLGPGMPGVPSALGTTTPGTPTPLGADRFPTTLGMGGGALGPGGPMPASEAPSFFTQPAPAQAVPQGGGARPSRSSTFNEYTRIAKAYEAEGDLAGAMKFRELAQKSMPEVQSREVVLVNGKPTLRLFFKDGTQEDVTDAAPRANLKELNLGGQYGFLDQDTGTMRSTRVDKTMTPGEVQQAKDNAAGRAVTLSGQALQRDIANRPVWSDGFGGFAFRPDANNPAGRFVQPADAGGRPLSKPTDIPALETGLRKEFNDLPQTKKFINAAPAYNAIVDASTRNNKQSDINLVYGLAKLYDPDSVVREGEYDTIAKSQTIPEWLKGQAASLTGQGGRLTPATRAQILQEARGRLSSYETEYNAAKRTYEGIATERGANPQNIFVPITGVGGSSTQKGGGKSGWSIVREKP